MDVFTITQERDNQSVYIYPNSQGGCMEWYADLPFGFFNYQMINNDKDDPDATYSYVWNNTPTERMDLYGLPNQSLSGSINYVQVFAKVRAYANAQAASGVFYLAVNTDSICTHAYFSNDKNLTTAYQTVSNIWTANPGTTVAWTWDDIDNLYIGIKASSPTYTTTLNATFRPTANGTIQEMSDTSGGAAWGCLNNETCGGGMEWVTFLYPSAVTSGDYPDRWRCNTYEIANHTTESGTINYVTLFSQHSCVFSTDITDSSASHVFYTHGTRYDYSIGNLTHTTHFPFGCGININSTMLMSNPSTSAAWTWDEIDALEIGSDIQSWTDSTDGSWVNDSYIFTAQLEQFYLMVNYNAAINPPIEVCQCYAKVNYVPADVTCYLNMPEEISSDHTRNTKIFNFWNGEREVYDHSRSSKSLVLKGKEWYQGSTCTNPCSRITCVRDMGRNGTSVTLSGFNFALWNGTYKIKQFGWKKIAKKPEVYEWILMLEDEG